MGVTFWNSGCSQVMMNRMLNAVLSSRNHELAVLLREVEIAKLLQFSHYFCIMLAPDKYNAARRKSNLTIQNHGRLCG